MVCKTLLVAMACLYVSFANIAHGCISFYPPNTKAWKERASVIVDASVISADKQMLSKLDSVEDNAQGELTWVLKLQVHNTLRGESRKVRFVATRFLSTTIVDEGFVQDLKGKRKIFMLISSPDKVGIETDDRVRTFADSFHVFDDNGLPMDEIWEGIC